MYFEASNSGAPVFLVFLELLLNGYMEVKELRSFDSLGTLDIVLPQVTACLLGVVLYSNKAQLTRNLLLNLITELKS